MALFVEVCICFLEVLLHSLKLTYPTWEKEQHLENSLGRGYVSSLEGVIFCYPLRTAKRIDIKGPVNFGYQISFGRMVSKLS